MPLARHLPLPGGGYGPALGTRFDDCLAARATGTNAPSVLAAPRFGRYGIKLPIMGIYGHSHSIALRSASIICCSRCANHFYFLVGNDIRCGDFQE